jgi:hypothetical protein
VCGGVFIVTLILFRVDATSNMHQLDFNKRILILKMHGTNIKICGVLFALYEVSGIKIEITKPSCV